MTEDRGSSIAGTHPPLTPMAWLRQDLIWAALADLPPSACVLEVGAGQGAMAVRLAERFQYTGVEADETSATLASERLRAAGRDHTFLAGRHEDVSFAPPYDAVCAFEVLEHIEDDSGALHAWFDLLRPGGRIVLSVPAWQDRFGPTDRRVGHVRRYAPDDLARLLVDSGYADVQVDLYGFPLGYVLEAGRNAITRRRPPPSQDRGTAESGRFLQPRGHGSGRALDWATRPFRAIQRRVSSSRLGTGLVATARRPA